MPSTRTGAQIIWDCLVHEGVTTVFGYPGGAILPAYDAMLEYPIRHVLVRHEQGATHMADGYARASGQVGVAIATSGPGATNLVTGIATAQMDSVPMVCITGQVPSHLIGYDAFQETDITGITLPITKHSYLVTKIGDIMPAIKEAFHLAKSGRPGPVLVDITKDAQQAKMEYEWDPAAVKMRGYRPTLSVNNKTELLKAAELIKTAKKPIILAGQGIIHSGAYAEVRAFAERTNVPVAMTLLGLGAFPASHSLNIGMMGMHGEAWVNHAIQEADLLLAFGMRFDDRVTGNIKTYALNAKKIHIDIDPSEINKNVRADAAICADLRETLKDLLDIVEPKTHDQWIQYIASMKGGAAVRDIQTLPDNGHLYAPHVINDIWRITEGKAIVVTDVGQHQMWEAQYYHHETPRSLITSGGLGTMGFGLPAAIGAKMARPDAEVWAVVGDGGFQMTQAELSTAAQEGVKVNVAIINNGFLGMVRQWQQFFYDKRYSATPLRSPDFVKLAEAHGLLGLRVDNRPGVDAVVEQARKADGTVVIDFRVEQEDSVYPMVPAGADLDKMIRRPEPSVLVETAADTIEVMAHTLVALVEDKPGVLNRVASLFRRRAFNIESLTVGRTDVPGISRMTMVLDSTEVNAERVIAYLYKLVNVLEVEDLGDVPAVARDLALVKVSVAGHDRAHLLRVVDETRAHIVDSGEQTMTLEITGEPPHVDAVISRLEPLGIVEMVRTGQVAMRRGDTTLSATQYS